MPTRERRRERGDTSSDETSSSSSSGSSGSPVGGGSSTAGGGTAVGRGSSDSDSSSGSSSSGSSYTPPPSPSRRDDSTAGSSGGSSGGSTNPTESTVVDNVHGSGASVGLADVRSGIDNLRERVSAGIDRATTPADPTREAPEGSSGDIDFRTGEQFDRVGDGSDIRTDTTGRQIARTIGQRGGAAGRSVGRDVADRLGAGPMEREVGGALGGMVGGLPGAAAGIGADVADAGRFVAEPVTGRVEPGAQLGADDISGAFQETGERTVETGTTVTDAGIEGVDRRFDIDFDRRDLGDGAAVQFTDDPETRAQLGAELTFGAFTAGASPAASVGARGAVARTRGFDSGDVSDFLTDTRATTTGRQRGGNDGGDNPLVLDGDDIAARQSDPDQTSVRPEFERGDDINPAGAFQRRRDQLQRGDRVVDDRSRDLAFQRSLGVDTTSAAAPTGTTPFGAGAPTALGTLGAVNDPTGIAPGGTDTGSATRPEPVSGAGSGGGSTVGELDATNDPTGVSTGSGGTSTGVGGGSGTGTGTGTGTETGLTTDVTLGTTIEATTRTGTRSGTRSAQTPAPMTDTLGDTTTSTIGEQSTGTGGRPTGRPGGRRPIPRTPDLPGFGQDDDDAPVFGVEAEGDTFGTGILSGDQAFEQAFGDSS